MKSRTIYSIAVAFFIVLMLIFWFGWQEYKKMSKVELGATQNSASSTNTEVIAGKSYQIEEIAKHNTASDCWLLIGGKVYDVTAYISSGTHPGGQSILAGCGKDATSLFNAKPSDGKPHSSKASQHLQNFLIGTLKS